MRSPAFFIWMHLSKWQAAQSAAKNIKRYAAGREKVKTSAHDCVGYPMAA